MVVDRSKKISELNVQELEQILSEIFDIKIIQSQSSKVVTDDLVPIEEAMKITNLARPTIYCLKHEGKIPFKKRPGSKKLFFSRMELEEWMRTGTVKK